MVAALGAAAACHLAIYGTDARHFRGLRALVMGRQAGHELFEDITVLLFYSLCIVVPIIAAYRLTAFGREAIAGARV